MFIFNINVIVHAFEFMICLCKKNYDNIYLEVSNAGKKLSVAKFILLLFKPDLATE